MSRLFESLALRSVVLRNRIGVSPMCQYSSIDGFASDWHVVHLGSRAVGGAGLVIAEATAVEAQGRISPADLGIWHDDHIEGLSRVARFVEGQGAVAGIQLAHAGRKAGTARPWEGGLPLSDEQGGWQPLGPSALAFSTRHRTPTEASLHEIERVTVSFRSAAERALHAGFRLAEIHAAHGYWLNSFLSPLSNQRSDAYGGSFDARVRLLLETVRAVRAVWPEQLPLAVRLSCSDWAEGGWTLEDTVALSHRLRAEAVDLVDCSSGGSVPHAIVPAKPGFQVPFAAAVRAASAMKTAAVGLISEPAHAERIIANGDADLVLFARASLRNPYFPLLAAQALGAPLPLPPQYARAFG